MTRVNLFKMIDAISNENVEEAKDQNVEVDAKKELEPQLKGDEGEKTVPVEEVKAEVKETPTSEPGPTDGGGDGSPTVVDVTKVEVEAKAENHVKPVDQTGLGEVGKAHDEVKANDGGVATTTSVEEHNDDSMETIETGEAESVGEADDLVFDIEQEVEESELTETLDAKNEELGEIVSDIADVEKVKASVESYLNILTGMQKNGTEMSEELKTSMRIGLESIDSIYFGNEFGLDSSVVSLEDIDEGSDEKFHTSRDATKSKLSGKLAKLWETLKRMFFRGLNALQDIYRSWTENTSKLVEKLKSLKADVSILEGGQDLEISNATRVTIDGEYVGDSPEAINSVKALAEQFIIEWPSKLANIVQKYTKSRGSNKLFYEMAKELDDSISGSFKTLKSVSSTSKDDTPSGLLNSDEVFRSEYLPGNRCLYLGIQRKNTGDGFEVDSITEASDLANVMKFNFSAIPGLDTNVGSMTVKTMNASEANSIIKSLTDLIGVVNGRREGQAALNKLKTQTFEKVSNTTFGAIILNDQWTVLCNIIGGGIARELVASQHLFIGYLISLVKSYIAVIEACIKVERGNVIDA